VRRKLAQAWPVHTANDLDGVHHDIGGVYHDIGDMYDDLVGLYDDLGDSARQTRSSIPWLVYRDYTGHAPPFICAPCP
jgi:hypothetical protein